MKRNGKGGSFRNTRLNGEIQKEIYTIITRKLKNPLVTEMVSVTEVDLSRDLSHAKVYISVYSGSDERKKTTFNAIKSDAKRIRHELAQSMNTRYVPELEFLVDDSMAYGDKIDKLLSKIEKGEDN